MTWTDRSDGTVYVLGLEKYTKDRVKYAAIVTFYPMDRKDAKNAGDVASQNDIDQPVHENAIGAAFATKYSTALLCSIHRASLRNREDVATG